jgi:O-methyltransferase domain/Dimerisation domain
LFRDRHVRGARVSERSPESVLWDFLRGGMMSQALAMAADLGLAELLAAGPRRVDEVARDAGADPDTLQRLLRALASDGVFAEEQPGVFRNTEASALLRNGGWVDFAHLFGGVWHRPAGELTASEEPTFPRIHGTDFWAWLAERPEERAAFDRAMVEGTDRRVERLARVDWRGDETVVDVGGGNGTLLVELLRLKPGLRGIVFDLPETNRDEAALGERIEFVAGSFFERVPAGDAYVLSTILHDWDDERAGAILRTIHRSAPTGARLVVLETVVPPGNEPGGAKWLDLLMLALFAGRERAEGQWRALLDGASFDVTSVEDGLIQARCR